MSTEAMEVEDTSGDYVDEEMDAKDVALAEQLEDALQAALREKGADQIPLLLKILEEESYSARVVPIKERAIYDVTRAYCDAEQYEQVVIFLTGETAQSFLTAITKAKTAKVVRHVLDIVCTAAPAQLTMQESVARSILNWTLQAKRSFLRQRVEAKLAKILFHQENYIEALNICDKLLLELKKLDDKQLLVETHLLESKVYFALRNVPKSKAALTASRTAANAIYVSPALQAEMDSMSGTTHCEEGDYNTAHSYFLEAFEQLDQMNSTSEAVVALKYMLLCKILNGLRVSLKLSGMGVTGAGTDKTSSSSSSSSLVDVSGMLSAKQGVKYAGRNIEAMSAIAKAASNRNLKEFQAVLEEYKTELQQDLLVNHHLNILQEQLLESNLIRIIEPYSCVELHHVAKMIEMPLQVVEKKLSQMILDGKFSGILDQGKGQLVIYEEGEKDEAMEKGLEVIANMDAVVSSLFERSKALRTMMI
jgi:26S proteasome regulatory subunit N6